MSSGNSVWRCWLVALLAQAVPLPLVLAESPSLPADADQKPAAKSSVEPVQVANRLVEPLAPNASQAPKLQASADGEHPLLPAVRWAREGLAGIEALKDYSAIMVKRERVNGKVGEHEYIFTKIRTKPFSVYLYFLAPAGLKGQEVIFVDGQNDGKMWAHTTGVKDKLFGTVSLKPDGMLAMQGQRYPLTEIGLLNMVRRLIEVGEQDMNYGECETKFIPKTKINDRSCTCIQVVHPVPRRNFLFHVARIFVDEEYNVPVRYESHDWPKEPGGTPELIEEYTYLNLKFNNGFTDADFDIRNPNYHFR